MLLFLIFSPLILGLISIAKIPVRLYSQILIIWLITTMLLTIFSTIDFALKAQLEYLLIQDNKYFGLTQDTVGLMVMTNIIYFGAYSLQPLKIAELSAVSEQPLDTQDTQFHTTPTKPLVSSEYLIPLCISHFLVILALLAKNLLIFYICLEAILMPLYFLIHKYGDHTKEKACNILLIFTCASSALVLMAIIILMHQASSLVNTGGEMQQYLSYNIDGIKPLHFVIDQHIDALNIQNLVHWAQNQTTENLIIPAVLMLIALAAKTPIFPLHIWLPHVHTSAPTSISTILSSVTIKLSVVGIMKFILPIFGLTLKSIDWLLPLITWLSLSGILIIGIKCYKVREIKTIIAYSSVVHMGYVAMTLFSNVGTDNISSHAIKAATFQMISHGFISAGLFWLAGEIINISGNKSLAPINTNTRNYFHLKILLFIFCLASIGMPLTSGFVGEFSCIYFTAKINPIVGVFACFGILINSIYIMRMYHKLIHSNESVKDISCKLGIKQLSGLRLGVIQYLYLLACIIIGLGIFYPIAV